MPPSSHYLNLLNLNQPGDDIPHDAYAAADLSKELELFTNSSFLDQESAFFPNTANYPSSQYDLQPHPHGHLKRSGKSSSPTTQSAFAPAQTLDLNYMFNTPTAQQTLPPAAMDLASHEQKRKLAQTDFSTSPGSLEADAYSPSTPGGSKLTKSHEEEDKRRRNTQASARFRVKKKQREQALQETAKQMTDKCTALESRVKELELENKWLRNLLKPTEGQPKGAAAAEGQ